MKRGARTLVGAVGYHNLGNHSIAPLLLPRLQQLDWPSGVLVEELNWGPVAVAQRLQAERPPFDRVVLLSARESGKGAGTITVYRWTGGLPEPAAVQARVAEAVTGVISVDNLLVVAEYSGAWPAEVFVVDVAPGPERTGGRLSPPVEAARESILETVQDLARDPLEQLEWIPLCGEDLEPDARATTAGAGPDGGRQ